MAKRKEQPAQVAWYADNGAHLLDELQKLDMLIRQRVAVFRAQRQASAGLAAAKGVYITHEEVDALLDTNSPMEDAEDRVHSHDAEMPKISHSRPSTVLRMDSGGNPGPQGSGGVEASTHKIAAKVTASAEQGIFLSLPYIAQLFSLSAFEVQTVIVCLAPELRRKYDTLYAYLQDDITRKRPSVDLILDLLCTSEAERWRARTAVFSDQSPLFYHGILHKVEDPRSPSGSSGLAQFLRLDPRMLDYLLENNSGDPRLAAYTTLVSPSMDIEEVLVDPALKSQLLNLYQRYVVQLPYVRKPFIFYLHGPYGSGARELAAGLCAHWGRALLAVDMELLLARETDVTNALRLICREALLFDAGLYVDVSAVPSHPDGERKTWLRTLARVVNEYGLVTFLAGQQPWAQQGIFDQDNFCAVELTLPDVPLRQAAWERALQRLPVAVESAWGRLLASQFRLTPGQIEDAVAWVLQKRAMQGEEQAVTFAELCAACRAQSHHKLSELAVKVEPHYTWDDLVLPADKLQQLRELCDQVAQRQRVYGDWGFARKLAHGRGISGLFAGPSGTGKTMAAEVIAHELQLDLYKIDLSSVVNKYIGETEKNLAKIFSEAEASNAILFFDEADALFGKRTKISDAHDRYANIETSYLLQRMEAYEGIVILATNLRENMDDAFTRRLKVIVDFPFPDAVSRKLIWQTHFPRETPVSDALDYDWLAQQWQITGGNIKNIVLSAAFSAAANGGTIDMTHVLHGTRREFEKIGKTWSEKSFTLPQR